MLPTSRDGDVFKHQDDSSDGELAGQGHDELLLDLRRAQVLEAAGNGAQNLDRVLASAGLPVATVEPGCNREDNDDEGIPED